MEIAYRHEIRIPIGPFEALELEQRLSAALRTDQLRKAGRRIPRAKPLL